MEINLFTTVDDANWEEMKEVYESVGWKKHTKEIIKQIFHASNVITLVKVNHKIIGFGRAITDGVFNAAIYDVVVHRDYQKLGIGKVIVRDIMSRLSHISCVHLISTTGNDPFYRQFGFKNAKTGMARYLSIELDQEYLE